MSHAIPRAEHPRPDFVRPLWVNLNGEWQFAFDDENVGQRENWQAPGKAFDKKIIVPFCFQCEASGIADETYHPVLWYRRSFVLPEDFNRGRVLLHIGAADQIAEVMVNGQYKLIAAMQALPTEVLSILMNM